MSKSSIKESAKHKCPLLFICWFPQLGVPPSIDFFHEINHPAIGVPPFLGKHNILSLNIYIYIYILVTVHVYIYIYDICYRSDFKYCCTCTCIYIYI